MIVNVNRQDVNNLEQLRAAVPDKDAALLLRINRDGGVFFAVVR